MCLPKKIAMYFSILFAIGVISDGFSNVSKGFADENHAL